VEADVGSPNLRVSSYAKASEDERLWEVLFSDQR
jgi:hypothetical protein